MGEVVQFRIRRAEDVNLVAKDRYKDIRAIIWNQRETYDLNWLDVADDADLMIETVLGVVYGTSKKMQWFTVTKILIAMQIDVTHSHKGVKLRPRAYHRKIVNAHPLPGKSLRAIARRANLIRLRA